MSPLTLACAGEMSTSSARDQGTMLDVGYRDTMELALMSRLPRRGHQCARTHRGSGTLLLCTRRPASADRTARRQFKDTGRPVSRTQASDAMTSRLPRYEAKCVQRRCFQCGPVRLRSDIKRTELPPANILIPLERQLIALQLCRGHFFYIMKLCSRLFVMYCRNCPKDDKFR